MERTLASIQLVTDIQPIAKADRLELATVLGWKVVVKKGEFQVGDKCIYCEVDSLLPEIAKFEFMRPRGFRLKTATLRGQLSQGLCFRTELFAMPHLEVGTDVTQQLGIELYRHPSEDDPDSDVIGPLPGYLPRTKEPRIQSHPELLQEMQGLSCYISTKINGKSCTVSTFEKKPLVCGRRGAMREYRESPYWKAVNRYHILSKLKGTRSRYAVQGEIAGPGIMKNHLELDQPDFFAFNVYDIEEGKYLGFLDFIAFCSGLQLQTVPINRENVPFHFTMEELIYMARGKYESGNAREGIVVRTMEEGYSMTLKGRHSFKVLNNKALLGE